MPRHDGRPTRDVAAEITTLIIDRLEKGCAPWSRPWACSGAGGTPLRHQGTPYTGINKLFLWAVADTFDYRSRTWMTYRQAEALGGQVRRGERHSPCIYYNRRTSEQENPTTGELEQKTVAFMRYYPVFNCDQIDGLPPHFYPPREEPPPPPPSERQGAIDAFFAAIPSDVRRGGERAYFAPLEDYIQLPHAAAFRTADHAASTAAHEHIHWTGHKRRLDRTFGKRFGDKAYCMEELVAEIGAGMVCADLGLPNELHDSHASYVQSWLGILNADKSAIITAAARAEAAYAYLKGFSSPAIEVVDEADAEPAPAADQLAA